MFPSLFQSKKKIKKAQLEDYGRQQSLQARKTLIGTRANYLTNNYRKL